jgi:hypothetical protein
MQETISEGTCMRAVIIEPEKLEQVSRLVEEVQGQLPIGEVGYLTGIQTGCTTCEHQFQESNCVEWD